MISSRASLLIASSLWLLIGCGAGENGATPLSAPLTTPLPAPLIAQQPAIAPALGATEVANATSDDPLAPEDAYRLLEQSTFGPVLNDIETLGQSSPETWINQQMQMPATFLSSGLAIANSDDWNTYVDVWWRHAIKADDQLRQRVAFALSQILVVSAKADGLGTEQFGLTNYYDILIRHAFGNYRDLLEEVTLNPIMGEYLSMKGNRKSDPVENIQPDENYAREVLQLFSIGQVILNNDGTASLDEGDVPIPAYDQSTIENFARVFTGWHFANADHYLWPTEKDYISPMQPWEEYHDTDAKTLLNGETVSAGLTARQDMDAALDNIFNHPNVGPFISKQLIQRLVTSNPSPQYVRDVADIFNENHAGVRGSLASTIKAILMHSEARQGHLDNPDTFGKLKEPLIRLTQIWRAFQPETIPLAFSYGYVDGDIGQAPLNSPTVFNFFRPEYSLPGEIRDQGLVSPEFQIVDETSIIKITSRLLSNTIWSHNYKHDTDGARIAIDISTEMNLEDNREELLDHLDLIMLGGRMSPGLRAEVNALMDSRNHNNAASQRVVEAIFLIATSPEAALQK